MTPQDLIKITGQYLLFLGIGTYSWTLDQFRQAAQFAKAHGVDTLLVKVADGGNIWFSMDGWHSIRSTILNEGVGAIPYTYSYGDTFGALDTEINIMLAHLNDSGVCCADMENEWNGQVAWAQHLESRIWSEKTNLDSIFMVSTWADPSLQNWTGVIAALAPCTTVFMPQQYNNYLATFWSEFGDNGATCLQPTVNLTQDFGPNDPVAIATAAADQGHTAISVWYYDQALANPGLLDAVYAAFPKGVNMNTYGPNSGDFNTYFSDNGDGSWICKTTGAVIMGGNLVLYQQLSMDGATVPIIGLPLEPEQYHAESDGYSWSSQMCERGTIRYDPAHRWDNQPGLGTSYLAHVNPPPIQVDEAVKSDVKVLTTLYGNSKTVFEPALTQLAKDVGIQ